MKHGGRFVAVAVCAAALAGCVERRYVIYTDPPGAIVFRNGQPPGATPVDDHYVYYGKYNFTIIADGYETLHVVQQIPTPWYEYFPLDFFSENVIPWTIRDRRVFQFHLEPRQVANPKQIIDQAQNLRNRGISLGGGSAQPRPPAAQPGPASPPGPGVVQGSVPPS